jgi:hypothetical protein
MNVPHLAGAAAREQYASRVRELVSRSLTDDAVARFLDDWESRVALRPRVRLPLAPIEQRAPVTLETRVRLATHRRLWFDRPAGGDAVVFHANDVRWECAPDLVPALQLLSGDTGVLVRDLCASLPDEGAAPRLLTLLTALAMVGAVWTEALAPAVTPPRT